jgi:hypothetical protein
MSNLKHADEMEEAGYIIDNTCYPWVAYKGSRFRPDSDLHWCYTELESMLVRELELAVAGFFLRDDRPLREGVPEFKGIEEAYSLHTIKPFHRHHVFGGPKTYAVRQSHILVFVTYRSNSIGPRS